MFLNLSSITLEQAILFNLINNDIVWSGFTYLNAQWSIVDEWSASKSRAAA